MITSLIFQLGEISVKYYVVVLQMSGVIQLTSVIYFSIFEVLFKVNADAVWLLVTHQFTEIHVLDIYDFYGVIHQAFVSKEEGSWEFHGTIFLCKSRKRKKTIINIIFQCEMGVDGLIQTRNYILKLATTFPSLYW